MALKTRRLFIALPLEDTVVAVSIFESFLKEGGPEYIKLASLNF